MNPADNNEEKEVMATRIVSMPLKKNFKVWLDSHNASSFSGTQFDARYFVDLNGCIRESWRLNSSYLMTFSFVSRASTFALGTVTTNNIYTVHIDLGQGTPTMFRYAGARTPAGIVRVSSDGTGVYTNVAAAAAFDIPVYFNAKPVDNDPVFINNLKNINTIALNLIQAGSGTFNSADNATVNTNTKYICCLNFQEV